MHNQSIKGWQYPGSSIYTLHYTGSKTWKHVEPANMVSTKPIAGKLLGFCWIYAGTMFSSFILHSLIIDWEALYPVVQILHRTVYTTFFYPVVQILHRTVYSTFFYVVVQILQRTVYTAFFYAVVQILHRTVYTTFFYPVVQILHRTVYSTFFFL